MVCLPKLQGMDQCRNRLHHNEYLKKITKDKKKNNNKWYKMRFHTMLFRRVVRLWYVCACLISETKTLRLWNRCNRMGSNAWPYVLGKKIILTLTHSEVIYFLGVRQTREQSSNQQNCEKLHGVLERRITWRIIQYVMHTNDSDEIPVTGNTNVVLIMEEYSSKHSVLPARNSRSFDLSIKEFQFLMKISHIITVLPIIAKFITHFFQNKYNLNY